MWTKRILGGVIMTQRVRTFGACLSYVMLVILWGSQAFANGPVVLYHFNQTSGTVIQDQVTTGGRLDLQILEPQKVRWTGSRLAVDLDTGIRSMGPATKIIQQCRASNELTLEVWVVPKSDTLPVLYEDLLPMRIVTLSERSTQSGFVLGQSYDGQSFYQANVRRSSQGDLSQVDPLRSQGGTLKADTLQKIFFTRNAQGEARLYVTDKNDVPILQSASAQFTGSFAQWSDNFRLTLANESAFDDPNAPQAQIPNGAEPRGFTTETRAWRGAFEKLAIYCRALSLSEILGPKAPTNWLVQPNIPIDPNDVISAERKLAQVIYRRLSGVNTPIDDPILKQMEQDIQTGGVSGRLQAAKRVTVLPGFFNRTVKDFAKRMSNRDEVVAVPLNDFSASIIGHTKDLSDARELLYGDFYYRGHPDRTAVPSDLIADILTSNRHYERLEEMGYDLSDALMRVNGQRLFNGAGGTQPNPDPAGVLTSRGFTSAHAIAGTNRRMVEFSFRQFLCRPIKQWADNTSPDDMVGRDVDRFPTGDNYKYKTDCRGCHSQMDSLRTAFARITFEHDYLKHAWIMAPDPETNPNNDTNNMSTMVQVPRGVAGKMNRNNDTFPSGLQVTDTKWKNRATKGLNAQYFGWNPAYLEGQGAKEFGRMIAEAQAFSTCMAERAFRAVCKREVQSFDRALINKVAEEFRTTDNYRLVRLFERIAVTPECLGSEQ